MSVVMISLAIALVGVLRRASVRERASAVYDISLSEAKHFHAPKLK
jgi:hypothetical protein